MITLNTGVICRDFNKYAKDMVNKLMLYSLFDTLKIFINGDTIAMTKENGKCIEFMGLYDIMCLHSIIRFLKDGYNLSDSITIKSEYNKPHNEYYIVIKGNENNNSLKIFLN